MFQEKNGQWNSKTPTSSDKLIFVKNDDLCAGQHLAESQLLLSCDTKGARILRSFEPPSPVIAPSSGDGRGRGDGDVRPLREPYPTRAAEGAAWDGAAEAIPKPRGGLTACKEGLRRQESR